MARLHHFLLRGFRAVSFKSLWPGEGQTLVDMRPDHRLAGGVLTFVCVAGFAGGQVDEFGREALEVRFWSSVCRLRPHRVHMTMRIIEM